MPKTINPLNNSELFDIKNITETELDSKLEKANLAFKSWKNTSFADRQQLFKNLEKIMLENKEELAKLDTIEMWMLYKDALWDITKSASNATFFGDNAQEILKPKEEIVDWLKSKIIYEPMWVVFSIMPWNFPFNQVLRSAIPNIAAWNTVVVKHASNVPQVALKLEELFLKAWFPEWVYTNLFIEHNLTEKVIASPYVIWVNITWSESVGRQIWALAWKYLKPSILELGWSDAFVLIDVENIDKIIPQAIKARFSNNWQKCNCSKRFVVLESVYDEFLTKFSKAVSELKVWDPMDESTQIWPLAKESAIKDLNTVLNSSIKAWAKVETVTNCNYEAWYFFAPVVLSWVTQEMDVFKEETFGPIAPVIKAKNIEELIEIVNNSKFGLWASIFGDDIATLEYIATKLEVWNVAINKIVTSYAHLPYGWIKASGYGKELWEKWLKAFMNEKVIVY